MNTHPSSACKIVDKNEFASLAFRYVWGKGRFLVFFLGFDEALTIVGG